MTRNEYTVMNAIANEAGIPATIDDVFATNMPEIFAVGDITTTEVECILKSLIKQELVIADRWLVTFTTAGFAAWQNVT